MSDKFMIGMAWITVGILVAFMFIFVLPPYFQRLVRLVSKRFLPAKKQPIGFLIVHADGTLERVSPKTAEKLGYSRKQKSKKGKRA